MIIDYLFQFINSKKKFFFFKEKKMNDRYSQGYEQEKDNNDRYIKR